MFTVYPEEQANHDAWMQEHEKKTGHGTRYAGAIGGTFTYTFTPTSIGVVKKVTCGWCKETHDFTDYDSW